MAKIEEIGVKPTTGNGTAMTNIELKRFRRMKELESALKVQKAALETTKPTKDKPKGADNVDIDETKKTELERILEAKRKKLDETMQEYITQLDVEIANSKPEEKKVLQEAKAEIIQVQTAENTRSARQTQAIKDEAKKRADALKAIEESKTKLAKEQENLLKQNNGKVINPEDPQLKELQGITDQLEILKQRAQALEKVSYTTKNLYEIDALVNGDLKDTKFDDPFGTMDDQMIALTEQRFAADKHQSNYADLTKGYARGLDPTSAKITADKVEGDLVTGGFQKVTAATEKTLHGGGAEELRISLPKEYEAVAGTTKVHKDKNGNVIGNTVIVKTKDGSLLKYVKHKVSDKANNLGYVTRQEPVQLVNGEYVSVAGVPAKLYYKKDAQSEAFSTVWDPSLEDNPVNYSPDNQTEFARNAYNASVGYENSVEEKKLAPRSGLLSQTTTNLLKYRIDD